ncbi:TIR domain-containing protein [Flavobacterium algoritolerans]|uniref:TIR domain-containing protein n=1 Tax=Flavobacterium algoritolerans TaxID=3041254 RepID=A0ABT6VGK6_9FLAO|nr:TIR domain-containing protein [Flavobacterium algoritolerans]MDI5896359.1 TIR domain-containing protein [Flavobacterium algoritolerans]
MATTCYACFDGDSDIHYYRLMQAWHVNEKFDFTFINAHDLTQSRDSSTEETIKRSLRTRLRASDVLVVLVGESTRNLYKFVRWEIEVSIELGLSIIVVNLDKKRRMNSVLCPPILRNELAIHVPFGHKIIDYAIKNWPSSASRHRVAGESGPYYYQDSVYSVLGL